jgi:shikimate kinase
MPGSGKSTIGRQLARARGLDFVDSDHEIEQRIGCSIRDYFEHAGEPAFRQIEAEVIAALAQRRGIVLATGGGAVLREENRRALRAGACVFYLRALPDELSRRLSRDTTRPMLQVADPRRRLDELFAQRDPSYRDCAHHVVDTARKSVTMIVSLISQQLDAIGGPGRDDSAASAPSHPDSPSSHDH